MVVAQGPRTRDAARHGVSESRRTGRPLASRDGGRSASCSIDAALAVVGDRWSILILRDMFKGIRRFEEIQRDLAIPRAVLTERLRRLTKAGVLSRRLYQTRPDRYEYRLTEMGIELSPILVSLMHWGDRWLGEGDPPVQLVHRSCGTPVSLEYYCWECAESFSPTEIRSVPPEDGRDR